MIRIIYDPEHLSLLSEEHRLSNLSEYVRAYSSILVAYENHKDIKLVVHLQAIFQWFKNSSSRFPSGTFILETIDAQEALAQRWGIDIPSSVTNEDILQAGILKLDVQPQPGFGFEDTLLANFYAPILTSKTFPFTQLTSILQSVAPQRWQTNKTIPLLARTLNNRLEEWKSKARSSEQRQLVDLFASDPVGLTQLLMRFRVFAVILLLAKR